MRRLAVASAILATLLTAGGTIAAGSTPLVVSSDAARATAALEYLLVAQGSDGSIDASLGETSDYVIGAAAAGYDPATLTGCAGTTGALDFIAAASDAASSDPAKTGKAILAVVAAGGDPSGFHGRDLLARLSATYHASTGRFGDGSTFSQAFALLALHATGAAIPTAATTELAGLQGTDGSWSYGSSAPAEGAGDTNSTSLALMALDEAGVRTADAPGLAYLKTQQLSDGGFPYQNADTYGPPASDPDSDAVVLEALVAAGISPTSTDWSVGSNDVLTHLRSMQGADGGFEYPGWGESAFTTSQVPAALVRVPYGAAVHFTSGKSLPTTGCAPSATPTPTATSTAAGATPTPTPSPTSSPTPKPTARRTARPTARPTAAPTASIDTPEPTPSARPTVTPQPTQTPRPTPSATAVEAVAGETDATTTQPPTSGSPASGDAGGLAGPLVYALAVVAGLGLVLGAGWLVVLRPGRKP